MIKPDSSTHSASPSAWVRRWQNSPTLSVTPAIGNQRTSHATGAWSKHSVSSALLPLPAGAQISLTRATEASNGSLKRGRD
ncbi:hypothetical protein [Pseudomonas monsensis]|uniref:hypothetical protein n=1 Tax=Pseudomonas monsensis TaxID=2745509 RepID=UPI001CEDE414|nr:hypothetical protein [Pseudomonas monsensis]